MPDFERLLTIGKRAEGNLGEGTFKYVGTQPGKYPELTLWRFEIYGGVGFRWFGDAGWKNLADYGGDRRQRTDRESLLRYANPKERR